MQELCYVLQRLGGEYSPAVDFHYSEHEYVTITSFLCAFNLHDYQTMATTPPSLLLVPSQDHPSLPSTPIQIS